MRTGWRPERRNRNIGTFYAGWRKDNRMVVLDSWHDEFCFYERLGRHTATEVELHGQPVTFLVEPARPGGTYGCSARDLLKVLSHLPADDVAGLKLLVMRQPTRKQELLRGVWGRCVFEAQFGSRKGPAIMLEAMDSSSRYRWSRKLSIEYQAELDRLSHDGHQLIRDRRGTTIKVNESSVRSTILFRTLLHEAGHWVDWKERVLRVKAAPHDPERQQLQNAYFARAQRDREQFAHSYAEQHSERLRAAGVIPFATLGW
jgi:hypothetical protein